MSQSTEKKKSLPLHFQILIAMLVGSAIGIAVNPGDVSLTRSVTASISRDGDAVQLQERDSETNDTVYTESFPSASVFADSYPKLAEALGDSDTRELEVTNARARFTYSMSGVQITWQRSHEGVPAVSTLNSPSVDQLPVFWQPVAAEHSSGIASTITTLAKSIGDLFLRLLKMVTVPLILTSLVTGVTGLGSQGRFGRMFGRTIFYYMITSLLAITTGLILVNLIQPGTGAILPGGGKAIEPASLTLVEILYQQLNRLIPTNPFASIAGGEFLSIISFAIMLGMFINFVGGDHGRRLSNLFESAFAVMMRMTAWVISLAPIGVAAFMIYATSTQGLGVFRTLAWYMLTVFLALVFHAVVILPVILRVFAKRNPLVYVRSLSPALLTAFSTASSNATLPLTMNCVEKRAGISNQTSSFVLPLGATINMDGTALYEVVAVLFIAQATPGFDLSVAQQVTVALTALIASIGAAGIPHAGLVMMAIVLQAVGLPLEAQGIIIAVDRVLDMCRTSVNVWSDSCGCAVVEAANKGMAAAADEV